MKAFYDIKPEPFEKMGNGAYFYRWGINLIEYSDEKIPLWQCEQVVVYAPLTSNKIVQAVIAEVWGLDIENKMLNEFNGAQLGVYDEATALDKIAKYKQFLAERNALKAQVDKDCKEADIR